MPQKLYALLDRDGTIIAERHYLADPEQVLLLPGAAAGLRWLARAGVGLVVITNQSGLGRGLFDQDALAAIHERMRGLLAAEGVFLDAIYVCPHAPADGCWCRKPRPGLLYQAACDWHFNARTAFVIGDKACDIEAGAAVGATTFLVRTGYGAATAARRQATSDYLVADLADAAQIITRLADLRQRLPA